MSKVKFLLDATVLLPVVSEPNTEATCSTVGGSSKSRLLARV